MVTKNCGTEEYSYSVFDSRTIPEAKEGHPTTKPIDFIGSDKDVFVERNGQKIAYRDIVDKQQ